MKFRLPDALLEIIRGEYEGCPSAEEYFTAFLSPRSDRRSLHEELIRFAAYPENGRAHDPWNLRCAAVLMLEREFLLAPALASHMGVPATLTAELRRRISRLNRIFQRLSGRLTNPRFLLDFIHTSRQPCKLTFARYLFDPLEIARRIQSSFRLSKGIAHLPPYYHEWRDAAARYRREELPDFERAILDALTRDCPIYWVSDATPSTLNALAEYPLTTVAAVVKPPGSEIEFEIKRAGVRGPQPLSLVFARDGRPVPWSHRLHGGSAGAMLDAEATSSARFAEIYRLVHGLPAPMSMVVGMSSVRTIPAHNGEKHLLSYYTNRADFGEGFDDMREQMARSVSAFESDDPNTELEGDLGLTIRFLGHVIPRQAVLAGSSSFRLKQLEQYLAPDGDQAYFSQGPRSKYIDREPTIDDARGLADTLLEEILGVFHPPANSDLPYGQYLEAAFVERRNRDRADRAYLDILAQIGKFWGTLLGTGSYSHGESFVDRNVGLRAKWTSAGWTPRIVFMDHDCLALAGHRAIDTCQVIDGMRNDEWYILGNNATMAHPLGEVLSLNRIYRTGPEVRARGAVRLRREIGIAYRTTRAAMGNRIGHLFSPEYLRELSDWEDVIRRYLNALRGGVGFEDWRAKEQPRLMAKGYSADKARELTGSAKYGEDFFLRYGYIYGRSQRRFSSSNRQPSG